MKRFLVIMRDWGKWNSFSEEYKKKLLEKYTAYFEGLAKAGIMTSGAPITEEFTRIKNGNVTIQKESNSLNGFFVIQTKSKEEAIEIASKCISNEIGETIEVFECDGH